MGGRRYLYEVTQISGQPGRWQLETSSVKAENRHQLKIQKIFKPLQSPDCRMCTLMCRLTNAALGGRRCDAHCHDQLRNTVSVHIRSRHIGGVSKLELIRFHQLSAMPEEIQGPAYFHFALAEVSEYQTQGITPCPISWMFNDLTDQVIPLTMR